MHEIVTLQFGNQSNYLGTHFWNEQVIWLVQIVSIECWCFAQGIVFHLQWWWRIAGRSWHSFSGISLFATIAFLCSSLFRRSPGPCTDSPDSPALPPMALILSRRERSSMISKIILGRWDKPMRCTRYNRILLHSQEYGMYSACWLAFPKSMTYLLFESSSSSSTEWRKLTYSTKECCSHNADTDSANTATWIPAQLGYRRHSTSIVVFLGSILVWL